MTTQTLPRSARRQMRNKVPEVTVYFWIIKILCTTVGESFADYINATLGFGLTNTTVVFSVALIAVLAVQFRVRHYVPGVYWLAVVLISVVGTLLTDNLTDAQGVPLWISTTAFAVLLAVVFGVWYARERTLSIHSIVTTPHEAFYWLTVLVTFALGTAAGDWTLELTGWNPGPAVLLPLGLIAAVFAAWRLGAGAVLCFWLAYILTRPLGANPGDFLGSARADGGLGLGTLGTSILFLGTILVVVVYLTVSRKDRTENAGVEAPARVGRVPAEGSPPLSYAAGVADTADVELDPRRWAALLTCCSALFMTLLDVSVTNVALPSIGRATAASPSQLTWVVSGYTLAFGLVPVLAGRLGDDHGRRVMFQIGVASFVATSMLAGLAPNATILIVARVLQGLAGGLINPQVSGLVQQLFPGRERGRAFGVLGTTVAVGSALGPLLGGLLIALGGETDGWRLVFFINVPVGLVVILLSRRLLPNDPAGGRHRLDLLGALLLGAATFCVLLGAVEYDTVRDARLALLAVPAVILLIAFARREQRLTRAERDPLVDFRLFRVPSYSAGVVFALAFFPAIAGLPLVLALYYQQGLGYSALQSGLGITAYALGSGVAAPLAGRVVTRIGRPLVVGATLTFALGAGALALLVGHGTGAGAALLFAPALFVLGAGSGAVITPNQALTLMEVDPAMGSTAGGVLQTAQRIGLAVGQAVVGAAFFAGLSTSGATAQRYAHAMRFALGAVIVFILVAAAIGLLDLVRTRRRADTPAGADVASSA